MKDDKTEMVPVPLPTEVPMPPRLDNIPLEILHSATVEMLIQQNEDLSSRLKVNIRRNSQMEQRILSHEKEISDLNRKRENVLAQIELIKEKEKIWSTQKQQTEKQAQALGKESELLELRYNELYTTSQQRDKNRQKESIEKQRRIENLEMKLEIFQRVRIRAKEKLRSLLIDMAQGMQNNHNNFRKTEASNRMLKKHFLDLKNEITEKETFFKEQLENLKTASKSGLMALDQRVSELRERNQNLTTQKEQLREEITSLTQQLHEEKKVRHKLSEVAGELTELQNERIRFKREMQTAVEMSESAREIKNAEVAGLKKNLHESNQRLDDQAKGLQDSEKKLLSLSKDNKELSTQLASIQDLWVQAQAKLEKAELKAQALEKINRQLSQQNQQDKVERATSRSQESPPKPETKTDLDPFQKKVQSVFASQYRTMAKPPEIDL